MTYTELVQPEQLRSVWPEIKKGLEKLPKAEWIPEDIYHIVKSGQAALFVGSSPTGSGFVVLRQTREEFTGNINCHVLAAYIDPKANLYRTGLKLIRQVAKQMGANSIVFGSPRKGWNRRFRIDHTCYSIPMEENT